MHTETVRKLNEIARIELTLSDIVREATDRVGDGEVRAAMTELAENHARTAHDLMAIEDIEPTTSPKFYLEMERFKSFIREAEGEDELVTRLSNMEREEGTRIEEALGDTTHPEISQVLTRAEAGIRHDVRSFGAHTPTEELHLEPRHTR